MLIGLPKLPRIGPEKGHKKALIWENRPRTAKLDARSAASAYTTVKSRLERPCEELLCPYGQQEIDNMAPEKKSG